MRQCFTGLTISISHFDHVNGAAIFSVNGSEFSTLLMTLNRRDTSKQGEDAYVVASEKYGAYGHICYLLPFHQSSASSSSGDTFIMHITICQFSSSAQVNQNCHMKIARVHQAFAVRDPL